jgi:hypothetical protein
MLKRLLMLVLMIGLLVAVFPTKSVDSSAYCSCSMACSGGRAVCQFNCTGNNDADIDAALANCCQQAEAITPIQCNNN